MLTWNHSSMYEDDADTEFYTPLKKMIRKCLPPRIPYMVVEEIVTYAGCISAALQSFHILQETFAYFASDDQFLLQFEDSFNPKLHLFDHIVMEESHGMMPQNTQTKPKIFCNFFFAALEKRFETSFF